MSVVLDMGTTTTAIARALAARTDLEQVAVITNGLKVALELEGAMPDVTVIVTGGTLRRLIAAAERTVVVAAGPKIGQAHLIRTADLADVGTVITGTSARAGAVAELRRAGADVIQVE